MNKISEKLTSVQNKGRIRNPEDEDQIWTNTYSKFYACLVDIKAV